MSEALPSPRDLFDAIAESSYGQDLLDKSRFGDFKPDWVSTELWGSLLGPDVNNLMHMHHTTELADQFSYQQDLNPTSTNLLMVTAATHDIGEAIIGDIALPSKTSEDEKREEFAYRQIAVEIFGFQDGQRLSNKVWSVLNKTDKQHGDMFRAVEYIGYCTTAMRAGHMAVKIAHGFQTVDVPRQQKEQLLGGLLSLEKAVTVRNFPILEGYVKAYPGIERML